MPRITQPNPQDFLSLVALAQYCISEAVNNNLSGSNPISVLVTGPSLADVRLPGATVTVIVATAAPATIAPGTVWLDPTPGSATYGRFQIATTALAATNTWLLATQWTDVFYPVARAASANNIVAQASQTTEVRKLATPAIVAGVLTLDLAVADAFNVSLNAAITSMPVNNVPATGRIQVNIAFTADGTVRAITWPTGTVWPGGAAPTMTGTLNKRDRIELVTTNGGTVWFATVLGQNY